MRRPEGSLDRAVRSPALRHAAALGAFVAVSCALLLPKLIPGRPGLFLANSPADGAIFLWSLGWWPHAIAHGDLLPYTHALFAPGGTNLAWTTSLPVPGTLIAPVTSVFGAFAAFDVLAILAPATAAWTTYLLAERVTRRWWASLAAGLVFALSPLETTEVGIGHLNLTLVALVPLAAYLVVRRLEGSVRPRAFVLLLGVVIAAQLGTSTEILLTTTLLGAIAMLLLYGWDRRRRPELRRCAGQIGFAFVVAGVLASPLLFTAIGLPHPPGLASVATVRTPISGVRTVIGGSAGGGGAGATPSTGVPEGAVLLLVVPLLAILGHLVWTHRRVPVVRAMAVTAATALALSVGVVVIGGTELPTPWTLVRHFPLFGLVRPQRMTMFFWLIAAVGVGVWLAERSRSMLRHAAGAVVIVALLPPFWLGSWTSAIPASPFVTGASPPVATDANVLVVMGRTGPGSHPFDDLAFPTVWQAESGFGFRLANAYVGSFPPPLPAVVRRLVFDQPIAAAQVPVLRAWLRRGGVRAIIVMEPTPAAVGRIQRLVGSEPQPIGGEVLFLLPP